MEFVSQENQKSLTHRENEVKKKKEQIQSVSDQRAKLRDEITEIVRSETEEEIKKMPFRNYLMEFVVPTLNEGLLECRILSQMTQLTCWLSTCTRNLMIFDAHICAFADTTGDAGSGVGMGMG